MRFRRLETSGIVLMRMTLSSGGKLSSGILAGVLCRLKYAGAIEGTRIRLKG